MPHGRHLFVSDLHLDGSSPAAIALFLQFLRSDAAASDGLYILGDLFETWIGDDDDDPARAAVCAGLRDLTSAGTPCHVLRGNRDFLLGAGFAARTGCQLLPDPVLMEIHDRRVVLSHGDLLCTGDTRYQHFRALSRGDGFQRGYLALPLSTRRAVAAFARANSREHTRQLRNEIMDVMPQTVTQLLRVAGADLLIHGHTHRPDVHALEVDGIARTRIVLGDWYEQGSCLVLPAQGAPQLLQMPFAAR